MSIELYELISKPNNFSDELLPLFTFLPFQITPFLSFYFFFFWQEIVDMCDYAVGLSRQINGSIIPSERELSHYYYYNFFPISYFKFLLVAKSNLQDFFFIGKKSLITICETFSIASLGN